MEYEYGYDDPVLGEVSCNDELQAKDMAAKFKTVAYRKTWEDGEVVNYAIIWMEGI